jgi:hypothetical protein
MNRKIESWGDARIFFQAGLVERTAGRWMLRMREERQKRKKERIQMSLRERVRERRRRRVESGRGGMDSVGRRSFHTTA